MFEYLWIIMLIVVAVVFGGYIFLTVKETIKYVNGRYRNPEVGDYIRDYVADHEMLCAVVFFIGAAFLIVLFLLSAVTFFGSQKIL